MHNDDSLREKRFTTNSNFAVLATFALTRVSMSWTKKIITGHYQNVVFTLRVSTYDVTSKT